MRYPLSVTNAWSWLGSRFSRSLLLSRTALGHRQPFGGPKPWPEKPWADSARSGRSTFITPPSRQDRSMAARSDRTGSDRTGSERTGSERTGVEQSGSERTLAAKLDQWAGAMSWGRRLEHWFHWIVPGLLVKRWLFTSAGGVLLVVLGLGIWTNQTPVYRLIEVIREVIRLITTVIPSSVSGPLVVALGLWLVFVGQTRTVNTLAEVLLPGKQSASHREVIDRLWARRQRRRGPKIVAIGGGTGLSTLLRGLKDYSDRVTAIVTVADDGGSSGRLRREIGVLPPGDIRNCLAALSDEEALMTELFQYRFEAGAGLAGHSFGNLFLTALSEITGDLEQAIAATSKILAIRGRVLPATLSDVKLWAKFEDGRYVEGESSISETGGKIVEIGCLPDRPPALPKAIGALANADYIIIGPGSLYTSILPNLLIPEIVNAIAQSSAPCIYVCNVMSQPGETDDYTVADHIAAIDRLCQYKLFDTVLVQKTPPSVQAVQRYSRENSHPVEIDREAVAQLGRRIVLANVIDEDEKGRIRHHSQRLAERLMRWYGRLQNDPEN